MVFPTIPAKEDCSLSQLSASKYGSITCVATTTPTTTTTTTTTTTQSWSNTCVGFGTTLGDPLGIALQCDAHTHSSTCSSKRSCKEIKDDPSCDSATNGMYEVTAGSGTKIQVCCDMGAGGWQLIYRRNNYALGYEQMTQKLPPDGKAAGVSSQVNSDSWWIPEGGSVTKWRWEVSKCNGPWQWIETNVPSEAFNTNKDATHVNVVLSGVATGGGMIYGGGTMYYQKGRNQHGCHSGSGTWHGLVRSKQGDGDKSPNGIGGHCDSCKFGKGMSKSCTSNGDCFTGYHNMEQYISNWKNVGGSDGGGGTTCTTVKNPQGIKFRMWAY